MSLFNSKDDIVSGGGGENTFFDYSKLIEDGNVEESFQQKVEVLLQDKEEEKGFQQEISNRSLYRSTSRENNIITEKSNMVKAAI